MPRTTLNSVQETQCTTVGIRIRRDGGSVRQKTDINHRSICHPPAFTTPAVTLCYRLSDLLNVGRLPINGRENRILCPVHVVFQINVLELCEMETGGRVVFGTFIPLSPRQTSKERRRQLHLGTHIGNNVGIQCYGGEELIDDFGRNIDEFRVIGKQFG